MKVGLLPLILLFMLAACSGSTAPSFEYPYTKTIEFSPLIYLNEGRLTINGRQAYVDFDIPQITSEVVAGGDVTIRLYDDGRWFDLPADVRYTAEGRSYYEGYIDYSYRRGSLRIVNGTTSEDEMYANYFNGGPYEVTVTD